MEKMLHYLELYFWPVIISICAIIIAKYRAHIKGILGEKTVAGILKTLPEAKYRILNDIMLETKYGTTQIDHIVVSVYGIFVIETKNYKGWITGSEYGEMWTKNVYGKKYTFRNPLKQNYAHVMALSEKLDRPKDYFVPIVVFSVNSDIKVKTNTPVVYTVQLRRVIKQYQNKVFEEEQVAEIVNQIKELNIVDKNVRAKHVEGIYDRIEERKNDQLLNICPRCSGRLVERKGKYGAFWGCSNYPNCRYTRQKGYREAERSS